MKVRNRKRENIGKKRGEEREREVWVVERWERKKMGGQGKEKGRQVTGSERNDTEGSKCKEGGKKKK